MVLIVPNVTVTLADSSGTVVEKTRVHNAFTDAYAAFIAKAFASNLGTINLALSHISLGAAGKTISSLDSISGWSGTPTLETASYREGFGAIKKAATASTAATVTSPAVTLDLATGFSPTTDFIELQIKVDVRARVNSAGEALRFTTSDGNYYTLTWGGIETANGSVLYDNTWTRVTIPMTAFVATGAPSWATITSYGLTTAANANGTLTATFDDLRLVPATLNVTPAATAVQNEVSKVSLAQLSDLGSGQARARAFWNTSEVVGTHRLIGLYGNGGATLAALVAPSPLIAKTSLLSLTVEWTITTTGG